MDSRTSNSNVNRVIPGGGRNGNFQGQGGAGGGRFRELRNRRSRTRLPDRASVDAMLPCNVG